MTNQPVFDTLLQRDGTSQAGRVQAALDPHYVLVDERSLKDLLAFAQKYAKELTYFAATTDTVQAMGDWSAFLSPTLDLDEVVAFINNPEAFSPDRALPYTRPHFALFLTFLQLVRHIQEQINTFTQRHLDFAYQQVLRMSKRTGTPDHVNVLFDLAPDTAQFNLPAGTLLNAGTDSLGQDLVYRTDQDLLVNHAQVTQLRSLYVDKRITGIREAREQYTGPKTEAFIQMLQIALGQPLPGDPLPLYDETAQVDFNFLTALGQLVAFVQTGLFMDFGEFRTLLQLKRRRDQADAEWQAINSLLEKAGQTRTQNPNFRLNPTDPRDFDANLSLALGGPPNFDGITQVDTINDLYDQRLRESVQQFIREKLYFTDINDFIRMMQIKVRIDNEWQEINRILEAAGQAKRNLNPPYTLPAGYNPTAIDANLTAALGALTYPQLAGLPAITSLDNFYDQFLAVEAFFFMSAEDFSALMAVAAKPDPTPQEWDQVYAILATAYQAKVYAARRAYLQQLRETQGFAAMIAYAAGADPAQSALTALARLQEAIRNPDDAAFLDQISQRPTASVTADEWDRVYRIVELAQRVRENLGTPVAQKEEWLNLYAAADATSVVVNIGDKTEPTMPTRWKTFGQAQVSVNKASPPPTTFGWAISSPLLALSQGQRTVTLILGFEAELFQTDTLRTLFSLPPATQNGNPGPFPLDQNTSPFHIEISTEKGWVEPTTIKVNIQDYSRLLGRATDPNEASPAIYLELFFAENVAAITPLAIPDAQIAAPSPVLRLMLRQIWQPDHAESTTGRYITHYQPFRDLVLSKTSLRVAVNGLTNFQLENDEAVLDAAKPFEPFGSNPAVGSHLYIGHPELITNKLDSLTFQVEWMGGPTDLKSYYTNYSAITADNTFTTQINLIDQRLALPLATAAPLFAQSGATWDATQPQTIALADIPAAIGKARPGYVYARNISLNTTGDLLTWNRYWQWELNAPDFQHAAYPVVATQKSLALAAAAIANKQGIKPEDYQVNPPYTPKIKKLSLNYTSSVEILLAAYQPGAQLDQIFYVQPFGYQEIQSEAQPPRTLFLPQYANEGELYLGIQAVNPPQNLALLFQMAEGSANPDIAPVPVQWSYLSANQWVSLDNGNVLQDTTRGLINSGIIVFDLKPADPNTLLPPALYWLRAAIPQNSNSVCDTVAIHAQAVSATFVDQANAPDHLSQPLPAESIRDLATPLPELTGVHQPYTSYGGKMAEQDNTFYTRISERLRHKQRALTMWDYEHLILDRFPEIYKAKCLPADPANVGQVDIIVIPDIRNKLPFNPFEPKAPSDLIADITTYLADHISASATVQVKNAYYVPVKVRFGVRFLPGRNEGYYKQLLNEELNRFLAPWAYDEGADIVIGGRIYANVIIDFIEQRPYVDYVANIKLFSSEDGLTFKLALPSATDGYWIETARPDGVLVAARQHEIDMIADTGYEEKSFIGINYMKIELDFIVG